jgi:autotransporter-associated beta strand protein
MPMAINAGGATVDTNGNNVTLGGALSGAGGLVKDGAGKLTLTLAGPYGGNTTIKAGTLALGSGASIAASPTLDVQSGATLDVSAITAGFHLTSGQTLKGTGTVEGNLIVDSGALHAPGASPGLQTINGNYTLASGGTLQVELNGPTAGLYDQLDVNGTVNLAGSLDLRLGFAPGLGQSFTLIDNDLTDAVSGTFSGVAEGTPFLLSYGGNPFRFSLSYHGNDGNDVVLTSALPEPTAWLLAALGGALLLALRRQRRAA